MHFRWASYYRPGACLHLALHCWEYPTECVNEYGIVLLVHVPTEFLLQGFIILSESDHGGSRGSISGQIVSSSFSCSNYSSFISCYRLLKSQENTLMTPIQQLICSKQLYSHSSEAATRKDVRRHIKRLGLSLNLVMFLCWTVLKTTQSHLSSKAELMGSILAILVNSKL